MTLIVLAVALQIVAPMMQWSGWAFFALAIGFYLKLRMSDPFRRIDKLIEENRKTLAALADEKVRVMELTNRNDELKTTLNALHAEHLELKGQFSQLNVAYGKMGEMISDLRDDLKTERELRDQQYMQWMKEKGQRGDL